MTCFDQHVIGTIPVDAGTRICKSAIQPSSAFGPAVLAPEPITDANGAYLLTGGVRLLRVAHLLDDSATIATRRHQREGRSRPGRVCLHMRTSRAMESTLKLSYAVGALLLGGCPAPSLLPFSTSSVTLSAPGGVQNDVIVVNQTAHTYAINFTGFWNRTTSTYTPLTVRLVSEEQFPRPGGLLTWRTYSVPPGGPATVFGTGSATLQLYCPGDSVVGGPTADCARPPSACPPSGPCSCQKPDGSQNDPNSNLGGRDAIGNVMWMHLHAEVNERASNTINVRCERPR